MDSLKESIAKILHQVEDPLTLEKICQRLGLPGSEKAFVRETLKEMVKQGLLTKKGKGYWPVQHAPQVKRRKQEKNTFEGAVTLAGNTWFFLRSQERDWVVDNPKGLPLSDGDWVSVHKSHRDEGRQVVFLQRIIRMRQVSVGRLSFRGGKRTLVALDKNETILPVRGSLDSFLEGSVVQVKRRKDGFWRPDRVLGAIEDPAIDESLVLAQFGILEREEDDQVAHRRQEAENIWEALVSTPLLPWTGHPQEGFRGRYDFSAFPTLTIDGEDARDFDDGLHWRPLESGCEVGIHIADVSSFVQPGSFWDRDAAQRGNSTYLPLRAIPMLDRVLSEQLCSLMPRSPRFTLSVIVRFDASDELQEAFLVPGRIVSGRRWQYAEADALLAGEEGPADAEEQQKGLVWALDRLSQSLRRQWRARGALEIDLPEPLLQWENQTDIASVQLRAQTPARRLIETLMVLANEQVAQWGDRFQLRMPFRGHQPPEEGHLTSLVELAKGMGVFPDRQGASATIQDLLFRIHRAGHLTQAQQRALMTLAVRHLALAQYVPTNQGHFGLGLSHYTHFTSPIRRYADLLVHRALHGLLVEIGPLSLKSEAPKGKSALTDELPFQWLSFQERMSDRAERSFLLRKVCHRLKRHLGDRFAVTVIAIQEDFLTVYVDDWHVEGRVPADTMGFTHYVCTPTSWVGPGGQTLVKLGDPLQLLLLRVHLPSLRLLFGQQTGSSLEARGKQGKRIVHPKRPQRFPRKRGRR